MLNRTGARLPQELIDNIIDYSCGSIRDLKSLSLIGRPWLPRSRKHLFHALRLDGTYKGQIIAEAISYLQAVLPLVRQLIIESSTPSRPFRLSEVALASIGRSFPNLLDLTLKGVFVEEGGVEFTSPVPNACLRNLTLQNVAFEDGSAMLHALGNPLYSRLHSLSVDEIIFTGNNPRSLFYTLPIQQQTQLQELILGSLRAPVLRALWGSSSPFDISTSLTHVTLCNRVSFDCADMALGNKKLWSNVTNLTCCAWRINVKLFPASITRLTMTYKTLVRQGPDSRLSHLINTSRKLQRLVLVFYWPHRTDSDKLNNIMSDFDEDLAEIAYALPAVDIRLRFVLKSEHSADFALMERLQAMFLGLDDALCSRREANDQDETVTLPIEIKEISDQEYRADLRLGLGFEY